MALTVGFVKECFFIAFSLKRTFKFEIYPESQTESLVLKVSPTGEMDVWYNNLHIWNESVNDDSFFGVESVDSISRIIVCIDGGDNSWKDKYYYSEKKVDKT